MSNLDVSKDIFLDIHKFIFSSKELDNPLPYYVQYSKAKSGKSPLLTAELSTMPYIQISPPAYAIMGRKYISARTLTAILASFVPWSTDETKGYDAYQEFKMNLMQKVRRRGLKLKQDPEIVRAVIRDIIEYLVLVYTNSNKVATFQSHRSVLNHVKHYVATTGGGVLLVDSELKRHVEEVVQAQYDMDSLDAVTKYFLSQDYKVGSYLISLMAVKDILGRYIKYNCNSDPNYVEIFNKQIFNLLGGDIIGFKRPAITFNVEYDPSKITDKLGPEMPQSFRDMRACETFLVMTISSLLHNVMGVEGIEFSSQLIRKENVDV